MEKQIVQILFFDEGRGWVYDTLVKDKNESMDKEEPLVYVEE